MTNPMYPINPAAGTVNSQPNYSGVTIQISNPAVYAGGANGNRKTGCTNHCAYTSGSMQNYYQYNAAAENPYTNRDVNTMPYGDLRPVYGDTSPYQGSNIAPNAVYRPEYAAPYGYSTNPQSVPAGQQSVQPQAYPPQYYLNNYNYQNNGNEKSEDAAKVLSELQKISGNQEGSSRTSQAEFVNSDNNIQSQAEAEKEGISENNSAKTVKQYEVKEDEPQDFTKSQAVIDDLDARAAAQEAEKKNTKQKRVVALTDEYIKSLENYLNNPNDEIRLMASKEILTRLDEDKDRYNDAALNALLNKMLQDPSKLIRVAALSAFASQLASGNDYTVTLLHNIQQNPNADKEDVLQAADILLKMSAGTEVKNIPNPAAKENQNENKGQN